MLQQIMSSQNGMRTPPLASAFVQSSEEDQKRMFQMENNIGNIQDTLQHLMSMMQSMNEKVEKFDNSQEAICQRLDFAQQAQLQTLNSSQVLLHKIDSSQEDISRKVAAQKELMERMGS